MMKKKNPHFTQPPFVKDGTYERRQELKIIFPYQFLLLCQLVQVPPKTVLEHFMNDLGRESWGRHENESVRTSTAAYFLERGYGQEFYSPDDIRLILSELNSIGTLWPQGAEMKLIEKHGQWRKSYYKYWFKKWFYKVRRK